MATHIYSPIVDMSVLVCCTETCNVSTFDTSMYIFIPPPHVRFTDGGHGRPSLKSLVCRHPTDSFKMLPTRNSLQPFQRNIFVNQSNFGHFLDF